MVQCSTAVKQMSLQMFFEYCQTGSVDDIIRESVPHGRRRDGESATADDRSCPRDDQPVNRSLTWLGLLKYCTVLRRLLQARFLRAVE